MNDLQIFNNEEFGEIRTVVINEIPMFCLADICRILELEQVSRVKARLNKNGVTISKVIDKYGREQEATFITESNLYKVIFQSRKESAERFTDWVTNEVLPSIRKNGLYGTQETIDKMLTNPDFGIQLLQRLKDERETRKKLEAETVALAEKVTQLEPKANYVDVILQSKSTVLVTQIAQDYGISAKALNKLLAQYGIQHKVGDQWILYSKYISEGYVHSKTINITRSDGRPDVKMHTEWTQKGRLFLYNILKDNGVLPLIECN